MSKAIKKFISNEKNHSFLIPIIAVIMGFILGSIIMIATGEDVGILFKSIIRAVLGINVDHIGTGKRIFSARFVGEYFVYVMPIVLTGLSVAFAFRTGMFNIGSEGQLIVGGMAAAVVGLSLDLPKIALLPLVVIAGALAGAIWGFIPGYLKARFNVHEVVVTIMMNYIGMRLSSYVLVNLPGSTTNETAPINPNALLKSDFLSSITGNSRLHFGFVIVIIAVFLFWFIINKTTFGYELKSVGYNPFASFYAGMKVKKNAAMAMAISGAFSGLAGVVITVGTFSNGRMLTFFENYGFDGITVSLVGGNTAIGSVFSAMLLGALKAAQPIMQGQNVPNAIVIIISSSIIVFVAMNKKIKNILMKIGEEK